MSAQRHLLGLVLMAGSLAPIAAGAYALRRRVLPAWSGAPARLAEVVIGLTTVVLVLQAVGSVAFEVLPVVAGLVLAGGVLVLLARWRAGSADEPVAPEPPRADVRQPVDRVASVVTVVAVAVVVGAWISRVSASVRLGMRQTDALYYHLPAAVRFVQDGAIAPLRVFSDEPLATFLPLNSSLIHGYGMLLLGDDVLSPYVNLGWLALALLAGWCVGVPYGAARLTLLATTVVLGAPGIVSTQAGEGLNDIAAAALILTAVALLANAPRDHGVLPAHLLAATAAGLAAGSKVTVLPILVVLAVVGVWVAPAGRRGSPPSAGRSGTWSAAATGTSATWCWPGTRSRPSTSPSGRYGSRSNRHRPGSPRCRTTSSPVSTGATSSCPGSSASSVRPGGSSCPRRWSARWRSWSAGGTRRPGRSASSPGSRCCPTSSPRRTTSG